MALKRQNNTQAFNIETTTQLTKHVNIYMYTVYAGWLQLLRLFYTKFMTTSHLNNHYSWKVALMQISDCINETNTVLPTLTTYGNNNDKTWCSEHFAWNSLVDSQWRDIPAAETDGHCYHNVVASRRAPTSDCLLHTPYDCTHSTGPSSSVSSSEGRCDDSSSSLSSGPSPAPACNT